MSNWPSSPGQFPAATHPGQYPDRGSVSRFPNGVTPANAVTVNGIVVTVSGVTVTYTP